MAQPAPSAPVIEVRSVSKRFGGVLALDQVSLTLRPGEVHAVVGENGAGKSTLIKIITGVHRPDGGEVRYRGEPVGFGAPREAQAAGISAIYQEVNLVPSMSVASNLFLGREPRRLGLVDFTRMHRAAGELLARYGMTVDVRRPLGALGLGMQQMVAVVRAVSTDARVVIMDEPTSSLEPREVDRLASVIGLLRAAGVAVLYVTHKLDEVFRVCQQVSVLRDGRGVHTGPVAATNRLRLVATMLGRGAEDVRQRGLTSFGTAHGAPSGEPARTGARSGEPARTGTPRDEPAQTGAPVRRPVRPDTPVGEPVLRADGLTRRHILDGVSLAVYPGEVVGLAGLLGSGRTETARAVFGADPVDGGAVTVGGRRPRRWTPATAIGAGVGLVPEDRKADGLIDELSVRDNIVLAALPRLTRAGFVSERRCDEIVGVFVRRLRIKISSPGQKVGQLSGGNQQKVLLARMLCLHPRVLILDEPTRGIDVGAKAEIQSLIDELAAGGLGVLLISSELEEVVEGADTVLVLRDGAVVGVLGAGKISEDAIMTLIASAARADDE